MTEETNTAAQSPEAKAQAMAHTAIKDVRTALSDLQGKFAGATTDHFAVPRHMLKDLEARIHTAEMWFLHLFPHLRSTQDEGGGAPTSADPVPTVASAVQFPGEPVLAASPEGAMVSGAGVVSTEHFAAAVGAVAAPDAKAEPGAEQA